MTYSSVFYCSFSFYWEEFGGAKELMTIMLFPFIFQGPKISYETGTGLP